MFRPIDLERHADRCVAIRRDSYVCSFGTDAAFVEENGPDGERYIAWLRERIAELPEGCVHVWRGDSLIGQMEMRLRDEPKVGYVNLFYLIPSARGSGAGDELHAYALKVFRRLSVETIRLSVSPTNQRAWAYYTKHGWRDQGPRPGHPEIHTMELALVGRTT